MTAYGEGLRPAPPYGGDLDGSARPLSPLCPNADPPGHLYWGYHCLQDHHLRVNYGLTCADYYRLLEAQDGGCGGCGRKQQVKAFSVDHDHETNEIRGLLCDYCNRALTQGIVHYLADPPARRVGPFFIPQDRLDAMARRKAKKAVARRSRAAAKRKTNRPTDPPSQLDRLKAMTDQGGA